MQLNRYLLEDIVMKRILSYFAVGLLGMLCGIVIGLKLSQKDHWEVIQEYRSRIEDPRSYEPAGPPGLLVADDLPDIGPSLAALVAKGELNHVDLVFPNVPYSRDVTTYWMQKCGEVDGIVEATGNHEYVEFKTSGVQPFHTNIWFTNEAKEEVKELIAGIESFANRKREPASGSGAPQSAERSVTDVVASWEDLGIWLPSSDEVALIRSALPESLEALRVGLKHDDAHVRMSTAYVAEKLGADAAGLTPDVLHRLQVEPKLIVRVYLADALAAMGDDSQDILDPLRGEFRSEQDDQVKTSLGGALVRLNSPEAEPEAWQWLLDSLKTFPPVPPDGLEERQAFWERRWGAVRHLRETRGKEEVLLPLLTKLRDNPATPGWVIKQQVADAVEEMESRAEASTLP